MTIRIIMCPIAIAQHGTDYELAFIILSIWLSICKHSYSHNFDSILINSINLIQLMR